MGFRSDHWTRLTRAPGQFRFFHALSHLVMDVRVAPGNCPPVDRLGGRCGGVFEEDRGVLTRLALWP